MSYYLDIYQEVLSKTTKNFIQYNQYTNQDRTWHVLTTRQKLYY
jgi:hypothetical protein